MHDRRPGREAIVHRIALVGAFHKRPDLRDQEVQVHLRTGDPAVAGRRAQRHLRNDPGSEAGNIAPRAALGRGVHHLRRIVDG